MPTEPVSARAFVEARAALDQLIQSRHSVETVERLGVLIHRQLAAGHKVMVCGNGGSACDAAHFAEELTGRFRADRAPLAAIACTDPGHITCTANDYGFEHVFSRWVEALGKQGDVLILLSTSGNSENMLRAAAAGSQRGLTTVALLGRGGGRLKGACDHELVAPGETSDRVQELHMLILHVLVETVESLTV
ncbi:MAG: SIS domain-containing protein [Phycisphaerales bacterium]